jgi:hypothetical protein
MRNIHCMPALAFVIAFCPPAALAQAAAAQSGWKHDHSIKPTLLDAADGTRVSVILDYDFKATYSHRRSASTGVGSETVTLPELAQTTPHYGMADLRLRGSLAADKARNPNKLIDFRADGGYVWDRRAVTLQLSGVAKYETDQGLEDQQSMFGIAGAASRNGILSNNDSGSWILGYGSVNPRKDTERKKLLGAAAGENYRRWETELTYSFQPPLAKKAVRSIDLALRGFQEVDAPAAIERAGRDRHRWGVVRLNLKDDLFIQYSRGSLPFDKASERAIKLGWVYKLE